MDDPDDLTPDFLSDADDSYDEGGPSLFGDDGETDFDLDAEAGENADFGLGESSGDGPDENAVIAKPVEAAAVRPKKAASTAKAEKSVAAGQPGKAATAKAGKTAATKAGKTAAAGLGGSDSPQRPTANADEKPARTPARKKAVVKPVDQASSVADEVVRLDDETVQPVSEVVQPVDETVQPVDETVQSPDQAVQPSAEVVSPASKPTATPPASNSTATPPASPPKKSSSVPTQPVREAQLALYRRYRPDTFADVIGQDHVTGPLQRALVNNKVNHAYLFSGPRGCGKTSSARILARSLNCEQGPTPTPCGVCQSCRDLATGGSGSIDVIEMDAASHGGVNEARDLRERAFFAPVSSRYKIYIIDEAHMVTKEGFNALLKLVEEPPPHVKFIFATTEPEKVIGTIRSRTHHYPFRLVPPKTMTAFLAKICAKEGVEVEQNVLPLVVRAGAGSVRDSLSVLDQLLGSAGEQGVSYESAAGLLGYTPDSLLDAIVDAFADKDASGVFSTIDKVIEVGQDPRRFTEDLLQRFRDLVIVSQVDDALSSGLIDVANDQGERLAAQAAKIGAGALTRAAEVIAKGLTAMRGTTAPRLHLEIMCARVLLPGADLDERGIYARLDQIERRLGKVGDGANESLPRAGIQPHQNKGSAAFVAGQDAAESPDLRRRRPTGRQGEAAVQQASLEDGANLASQPPHTEAVTHQQRPPRQQGVPASAVHSAGSQLGQRQPQPAGAQISLDDLRRAWPAVLDKMKERRRFAWMVVSQNAQLAEVANGALTLEFTNSGACNSFTSGGSSDVLHAALIDVMGVELRIVGVVGSSVRAGGVEPKSNGVESKSSGAATAAAAPEGGDGASFDDTVLEENASSASELLTAKLGAQVIDVQED